MASIVKTSLVGYWHYAQGVSGTTWQNIAPNYTGKYNGTINGAVLQSGGMYFNGTSSWVSIGAILEIANNYNWTIEILFNKPTATSATTTLVSQNDGSAKVHHIKSYYSSGYGKTIPESLYKINSTNYDLTGGNIGFNNTDNLVTITNASGSRNLYLNGAKLANSTMGIYANIKNNAIGALIDYTNTPSNFFTGIIKAVRIYNKTLTDAEVTQNYSVGADIGLVESTTINFDTLQNLYLRYDLKQSLYLPVSINYDTLQHFVDATPQSSTSVQDAIKIYKTSDQSIISTEGIMDNPIQFTLNISNNESKEQRFYIKGKGGYTLSDVTISFIGDTSNKWQLALDVNGSPNTYLDPLTSLNIGTVGGVAGQDVYFWVKANSNNSDLLGNDISVILNVTGMVSIF